MNSKNTAAESTTQTKPMQIVGAGPLTSAIWKIRDTNSGWQYRFSVVWDSPGDSRGFPSFRPADLIHLLKLVQLLASEIAADGCLAQADLAALRRLAADLDIVPRPAEQTDVAGRYSRTI